ncbi:hypothetical protein DY000_02023633 [Brassica cretica]|uniref:Transposase (Putative), gypsy type n=1 Tax=Brassica cretica TaxID=69181 RepID=A0ABQ7E3S2_BRACR|nr:hypothetical protein DY000_02023633 [Brassica cretica]
MGCHARRLDLTCWPFQDRVVDIENVEIELPVDDETSENVRPGYCRAYASHFEAGGLSFPLPRFLLEVLAEIKMDFTQMAPNFFRYFLGCLVRAQEEGLEFGLGELRPLFAINRNNGFPGTVILSPRGGRGIIEGIPNKDDRWREKFFVFKINLASVGDFDFERIPREWSDDIEPFGYAPMSPELHGLIETLRRGSTRWLSFTPDQIRAACALPPGANRATHVALVAPVRPKRGRGTKRKKEKEGLLDRPDESYEAGSLERARKVQQGQVLRPRSHAQSPGLLARPVSVAIPSGGAREAPDTSASSAGDRALNDEIDSSSHQSRRRVLEEINSVTSGSSSPRISPPEVPILENPDSHPAIWCKVRVEGCELTSLEHMRERDAYVRMAVANAKAMEASNDYDALMEGRLENFPSKEEIAGHLLTIQQLRGELGAAREAERQRELEIEQLKKKLVAAEAEKEYEGIFAVVKDKLEPKKKETAVEILLQEMRAPIEALTEYSEGGFKLEAELERLKDLEVSLDVDYGLASVSDPSLGRLDLPEISGDLVNQD